MPPDPTGIVVRRSFQDCCHCKEPWVLGCGDRAPIRWHQIARWSAPRPPTDVARPGLTKDDEGLRPWPGPVQPGDRLAGHGYWREPLPGKLGGRCTLALPGKRDHRRIQRF